MSVIKGDTAMSIYEDKIALALELPPMPNQIYEQFLFECSKERNTIEKISSINRGKTYEELYGKEKAEHLKKNISEKNKNKIVSEEVKEKLRKANATQFSCEEKRKTHLTAVLNSNGNHKGSCWVNDGKTNKRIKPEEVDKCLNSGWVRGRLLGEKKFYEFSKPNRDVISGRFLKKGEKNGN
jgi:hypothetical protein